MSVFAGAPWESRVKNLMKALGALDTPGTRKANRIEPPASLDYKNQARETGNEWLMAIVGRGSCHRLGIDR